MGGRGGGGGGVGGEDWLASAVGYGHSLLGRPGFLLINIYRLSESIGVLSREGENMA